MVVAPMLVQDCNLIFKKKKKCSNPHPPHTFRALGWNAGKVELRTLPQPVRLLYRSPRDRSQPEVEEQAL